MHQGEGWEKRLQELAARELDDMYALYAEQPARLLGRRQRGDSGATDSVSSDDLGYTSGATILSDATGSDTHRWRSGAATGDDQTESWT